IPESTKSDVKEALSYYHELADIPIKLKTKDNIKKSTMQAQPQLSSIIKQKENREYLIFISLQIQTDGEHFTMADIPPDVVTGWIGYELGHVMYYHDRTNVGLIIL